MSAAARTGGDALSSIHPILVDDLTALGDTVAMVLARHFLKEE
jgi:hypothetical protein